MKLSKHIYLVLFLPLLIILNSKIMKFTTQHIINSIAIFSVIFLFASCTQKVDIDLNKFEEKVVIEGEINTESNSYIIVSKTTAYFSQPGRNGINNAIVVVSTNDSSWNFVHSGGEDGLYRRPANFKGIPNTNYKLSVIVDGKEYTAESYLNPMNKILDTLSANYKEKEGFVDAGYAITYYSIEDRPGVNYTQFKFGVNDTFSDFTQYFDSKNIVRNILLPFELPFFRAEPGDSVMILLKSLDYASYSYLVALNNLDSGAPGPFQSPPANPPTNIKGGGIGYFSAYDIVRRWKIVP